MSANKELKASAPAAMPNGKRAVVETIVLETARMLDMARASDVKELIALLEIVADAARDALNRLDHADEQRQHPN